VFSGPLGEIILPFHLCGNSTVMVLLDGIKQQAKLPSCWKVGYTVTFVHTGNVHKETNVNIYTSYCIYYYSNMLKSHGMQSTHNGALNIAKHSNVHNIWYMTHCRGLHTIALAAMRCMNVKNKQIKCTYKRCFLWTESKDDRWWGWWWSFVCFICWHLHYN